MNDIVERLHQLADPKSGLARGFDDAQAWLNEAVDEIERLRRWKAEAIAVLDEWESVWLAAGRPGSLGQSKAAGVRDAIQSVAPR